MKSALLFVLGGICGALAMFFVLAQRAPTTPAIDIAEHQRPIEQIAEGANPGLPAAPATTLPAPATATPMLAQPAPSSTQGSPESTAVAEPGNSVPSPSGLLIPVDGIHANQLTDTFDDARAAGRVHDAIDIMAPRGTRVLAVADGKVAKLFTSVRGGLTVYEFDPSATYSYYYAHLDSYAPGLVEGKQLQRGDLIGFVGSSGDASPTAPHLHFAINVLGPDKRWWQGTPINPYPILTGRQPDAPAQTDRAAAEPNRQ